MSDVVARAKVVLEGVTPGPWHQRIALAEGDQATHAEWLAGSLIGEGEALHVLIADSPDSRFAYIVPAVTGDGPTSRINAEFIAAARDLVPELVAEVERLREGVTSIEHFARLQALSDHARSGPSRESYHSAERYWLDLLTIIERVQGGAE